MLYRLLPLIAAALALAGLPAAAATVPSQDPLVSRASAQVKPNMFMTFDDSGSMTWDFMPSGVRTINGGDVVLPPGTVINDVAGEPVVFYGNGKTAPGIPGSKTYITQKWLRSPDINTIYYNPDVLYLPWMQASGTRMAAAKYGAALYDPNATPLLPGSVNLGVNYQAGCPAKKCPAGVTPATWLLTLTYDSGTDTYNDTTDRAQRLFDPALFYRLKIGADPTLHASYVEYDLNETNGALSLPPKALARTDCAASVCTLAEERQNFANWFVFFRARHLMVKAALSETLPSSVGAVRLGWGSINEPGVIRRKIADLTPAWLAVIMGDIQTFTLMNSTPLRDATRTVGDYFMKTDADSVWYDTPGDTRSGQASCRRAYNLLMTDGYYNDDPTPIGYNDNTDGPIDGIKGRKTSTDNPLGYAITQYKADYPYKDTLTDTLADFAMYYYVNDLQPGIPNKVTADQASGDVAYWQHLQQYTVGLGVTGLLDPATDLPNLSYTYDAKGNKVAPAKTWSDDRIDDLWHAAVDTHGKSFSAKDATSLSIALSAALNQITTSVRLEAGAATSISTLSANGFKYVPSYSPAAWVGEVTAYKLDETTGATTGVAWLASNGVPAFGSRNSYTWDSAAKVATKFTWGTMGVNERAAVTNTSNVILGEPGSTALIDYINGDVSNEGPTQSYRARGGKLPDFVDSAPLYVRNFVDAGYGTQSCNGVTYGSYLASTKGARTNGAIFVGGNGGMLHAFSSADGSELFAYAPSAVMSKLPYLASKDYGTSTDYHQFFVDGPNAESDACIVNKRSATVSWTNLVVGTLGAGGRGLYALDVTPVGSATPALGAKALLREWSPTDDSDIGYMYAAPQVGMINGGAWKIFIGNGVYSSSGKAFLMVIDLTTMKIDKIALGSSTGNGAMGVRLIYNSSQQAIGAYVGDLLGNLWRVEFQGTTSSTWQVGYKGEPLFRAKNAAGTLTQSIMEMPLAVAGASGTLVEFGTGRLIDSTDSDNTDVQTFYAVNDPNAMTIDTTAKIGPFPIASFANPRTQLGAQTISNSTAVTVTDASTGVSSISNYYTVSPPATPLSAGWYMDLQYTSGTSPASSIPAGTRVIDPAQMLYTSVFINAVTPSSAPAECDPPSSGKGYYFLLDGATGNQYNDGATWDTNGDHQIDSADTVAAGYSTGAGGVVSIVLKPTSTNEGVFETSTGDKLGRAPPTSLAPTDRVWRQIMTPPTP